MSVEVLKTIVLSRGEGSLLGFANVRVDGWIEINGLRILEGREGLFVAMPQREYEDKETGEKKYSNVVWIADENARADITAAVLDAFGEEKPQRQASGYGQGGRRESQGGQRRGEGKRGDPNDRRYRGNPAPQRPAGWEPAAPEFGDDDFNADDGFPDALPARR